MNDVPIVCPISDGNFVSETLVDADGDSTMEVMEGSNDGNG